MIYVCYGEIDFCNEVDDVIKLFYKKSEIEKIEKFCFEKLENDKIYLWLDTYNDFVEIKFFVGNKMISTEKLKFYKKEVALDIRRNSKWEIKRGIFVIISKYLNKELPWGMLTGIRPVKIVNDMIKEGLSNEEIRSSLKNYHFLSDKKLNLAIEIAKNQISKVYPHLKDKIFDKSLKSLSFEDNNNEVSIYIGIPFCVSRCLYCSFTSFQIDKHSKYIEKYIECLIYEMIETNKMIIENNLKIKSIYIGGGTPTSLDNKTLEFLLNKIDEIFQLENIKEYTIEAGRPDTLNREKLLTIKNSRVKRISINPQSMNDITLDKIGRKHTSKDIIDVFKLAREIGFDNINMDLIAGLPGENIDMFINTLSRIEELKPDSITVHTLSVKRASLLKDEVSEHKISEKDEVEEMLDLTYELAKRLNMNPYYLYRQKNIIGNLENVGYCKDGLECFYNIDIMEENHTILACGAGAVTKVVYPKENRLERAFNMKDVIEYIQRIDEMIERKRVLLY